MILSIYKTKYIHTFVAMQYATKIRDNIFSQKNKG